MSLDTRGTLQSEDTESMMAMWRAHSAVGRTVTDDSFKGGWEDALYELIKNSIDADAKRIRITCPATDLVPAEQRLVAIEDDGHGMTPEAVRDKFCVVGRAKKSHDGLCSPGGRPLYGERGTGRLSCFVVAGQVEVETTARGKTSHLELTRAFVRSETPDPSQEVKVTLRSAEPKRHGTRVTLTSFQHGLHMPTADAVGRWILRRFGEPAARIEINGRKFAPTDYGREVARFDVEEVDGFGTVDGSLWLLHDAYRGDKKADKWLPGILLTMNGQHFFGPHLFDLASQSRSAVVRSAIRSLLGRIEVAPLDPDLPQPLAWPQTEPYCVFTQWIAAKIEAIVRRHVDTIVTARVDSWMQDAGIRRVYDRLDERKKESAKRVLMKLAQQRLSDRSEVRTLARMALRCVEASGVRTAADDLLALPLRSEGAPAALPAGHDRWSLRRAAEAFAALQYRERTLDELAARSKVAPAGDRDLSRLIENNLWILDEALGDASHRADDQTREAARSYLDLDPTDPALQQRVESLLVLRDPSDRKVILIDLKGPEQPLSASQREELIRIARGFVKARGGFARTVLLGPSEDKRKGMGEPFEERSYSFEGLTYERLIERARARLKPLREAIQAEEADVLKVAQDLNEAEITELMGLPETDDVMVHEGNGAQLSLATAT